MLDPKQKVLTLRSLTQQLAACAKMETKDERSVQYRDSQIARIERLMTQHLHELDGQIEVLEKKVKATR